MNKIFISTIRIVYYMPYFIRYIFHWLLYNYNKIKEPEKMRYQTTETIKLNAEHKKVIKWMKNKYDLIGWALIITTSVAIVYQFIK